MPQRKITQGKGAAACVWGVGHTVSDSKVIEGLSERATLQQVQGIWFPAHGRLEVVY